MKRLAVPPNRQALARSSPGRVEPPVFSPDCLRLSAGREAGERAACTRRREELPDGWRRRLFLAEKRNIGYDLRL